MKSIQLRAYAPTKKRQNNLLETKTKHNRVLVFDTETTTDEYQNLKFGFFQVYLNNVVIKQGLFYDNLSSIELEILNRYSKQKGIPVYTLQEFIDKVFYYQVFHSKALCIGFNLAFDLSRIAFNFTNSRNNNKGGFTFKLSENKNNPPIVIKKLGDAYSFSFQRTFKNRKEDYFSGNFLDVQKLAEILLEQKHISLSKVGEILNTTTKKQKTNEHGKITKEYIDYNIYDVLTTYNVYTKLVSEFERYNIDIPITKVYSSASLGKYALNQLGINPFRENNPDFDKSILGNIMTSYYGGRCECNYRKKPILTDVLDFTSMYPTITILYDIWDFIIAKEIITEDVTLEIKGLLKNIDLEQLKDKKIYKMFNVLVKIKPNNDFLPIRMDYKGDNKTNNVGLNYLTSNQEVWYSLPDVIASKIYINKVPEIIKAIRFIPKGIQDTLKSSNVVGIDIDPKKDNLIKILVEERQMLKNTPKDHKDYNLNNSKQKSLKILVNALSYGIFIELNTKVINQEQKIYGLNEFKSKTNHVEAEGRYFNPVLATIITSGARLFLTIAQTIAEKEGQKHYYMDTDSIFVSPDISNKIINYFNYLNPYELNIPILKKDKENLLFYGICSKRYCLYQLKCNTIDIIDYKLHGLGHLINPYNSKIADWHKEIWQIVIQIYYGSITEGITFEKYSGLYGIAKLTISTPNVMRRFNLMNKDKEYLNHIKPFNFVYVGFTTKDNVKPLIPFGKDPQEAVYSDFIDYKTGEIKNGIEYWKALGNTILDFYDHLEKKFNGDIGYLERKSIISNDIQYIGKEANNIDEEALNPFKPIEYKNNDQFKRDLETLSNKELKEKYGFKTRSHVKYWKDKYF
ncbi:MAG: hypothetical protein PHN22_03910 [Candidatus ainarchaeum sp.]|nr:hypothetical protein [Candidatus ainarchaeum sp.]